jgi:hypothetical protein
MNAIGADMNEDQINSRDNEDLATESHENLTPERGSEVDLSRVRDLVLAAHPDVVPELVQGATFDELMASVEPARDAYERISAEATAVRPAPKVAAQPGQRSASLADVESLSPLGKISEGLRRQ